MRKPTVVVDLLKLRHMREQGATVRTIAIAFGIADSTVYRYLAEIGLGRGSLINQDSDSPDKIAHWKAAMPFE